MKKLSPRKSSLTKYLAFSLGLSVAVAHAADQTYDDANASNVWDLTTQNWDSSSAVWTNGNNATFGGTGESVAINDVITVGNLTFNSTGYTIAAGTGSLSLAAGGDTLSIGSGNSATISAVLGGSGASLLKTGAGTVSLTNANTFTGGVTVTDGILYGGNAAAYGTGTITLNGGRIGATGSALAYSNAIVANANTASAISGNGQTTTLTGFLKGSGTLSLGAVSLQTTNRNTSNAGLYNGFTGSLQLNGALGFNSPSSANGADYYYNLSNAAVTLNSGASTAWFAANGGGTNDPGVAYINLGSISSATGVGTLGGAAGGTGNTKSVRYVVGTLNTDTTFGGVIANGGGQLGSTLVKAGSGTLTLTGTSTYSGFTFGTFSLPATTIRGGTLQVGDGTSGALASTGALTFTDSGRFNYQGQNAGSSQSLGALTFSAGAGTVQSSFGTSGTTSLTFSNVAARTAGATANFVVSGGTNGDSNKIVLTQVAGATPTTGALLDKGFYFNGSDFAAYDANGYLRALSYGVDTSTSAVDAIAAGTHVKLTAAPASQDSVSLLTLNLAGSGVSWANNASQTLTISGGGLIKSGGGSASISGGTALTTGGATELVIRTDAASDSLDIQTPISNTSTGGLTKSGAGTLTLSAAGNAWTGATKLDEGTVSLTGAYSGASAFTINNSATLNVTGTLSSTSTMIVGNSSGNGVMNVSSGASVSVAGLNISQSATGYDTATGSVNVNGGTLTSTNDIIVGVGGTQTGKLIINSGTVNVATTAIKWLKIGDWDTVNGQLDLNGGTLNLNTNSAIKFNPDAGGGINVFNQNGGNVVSYSNNGTTLGGSTVLDMQTGASTTVNNTYNLNAGTLAISQVTSSQTGGARTFNFNGGTLKVASNSNASSFFNLGAGNARANVRNGGAILDTNGIDVTVAQPLAHSNVSGDNAVDGGLTKNGLGKLTLTGVSTYTGSTVIASGTLALGATGWFANSNAVDIQSGATLDVSAVTSFTVGGSQTLKGKGTLLGNAIVNGIVSPGASAGSLSVTGNFTLASTASANFELQAGDVTIGNNINDLIAVTGDLTLDGTLNITELGGSLAYNSTYRLFTYTGTLTNNTLDLGSAFLAAHPGSSIDTTTAGQVNLLVVPEPSTFAMLLSGIGSLLAFRRRRS